MLRSASRALPPPAHASPAAMRALYLSSSSSPASVWKARVMAETLRRERLRATLPQLTVAVIKPEVACHPVFVQRVMDSIAEANLRVLRRRELSWDVATAARFYAEHQEKFFYQRLVEHMSSGPMIALACAAPNAIKAWRTLLGPTKCFITRYEQPQSLRGRFGISDTRNGFHGSDSVDSVKRELPFFFPQETYEGVLEEYYAHRKTRLLH